MNIKTVFVFLTFVITATFFFQASAAQEMIEHKGKTYTIMVDVNTFESWLYEREVLISGEETEPGRSTKWFGRANVDNVPSDMVFSFLKSEGNYRDKIKVYQESLKSPMATSRAINKAIDLSKNHNWDVSPYLRGESTGNELSPEAYLSSDDNKQAYREQQQTAEQNRINDNENKLRSDSAFSRLTIGAHVKWSKAELTYARNQVMNRLFQKYGVFLNRTTIPLYSNRELLEKHVVIGELLNSTNNYDLVQTTSLKSILARSFTDITEISPIVFKFINNDRLNTKEDQTLESSLRNIPRFSKRGDKSQQFPKSSKDILAQFFTQLYAFHVINQIDKIVINELDKVLEKSRLKTVVLQMSYSKETYDEVKKIPSTRRVQLKQIMYKRLSTWDISEFSNMYSFLNKVNAIAESSESALPKPTRYNSHDTFRNAITELEAKVIKRLGNEKFDKSIDKNFKFLPIFEEMIQAKSDNGKNKNLNSNARLKLQKNILSERIIPRIKKSLNNDPKEVLIKSRAKIGVCKQLYAY